MAEIKYTYTKDPCNSSQLLQEIADASLAEPISLRVNQDGGADNVEIWFDPALSAPDKTTLDDIVSDHIAIFIIGHVKELIIPITDEDSVITAGVNKTRFRMPCLFKLTELPRVSLNDASTSGVFIVDINEDGVSILSTKITVDQDEETSMTAATPAVISDYLLANNAEMGFDVDDAGVGAKGAKVTLIGCEYQE